MCNTISCVRSGRSRADMPNKGKKPAGGAKGHGGKKPDGTSKPTDKKSSETAEKKHGTTSTSASTSAAAAASSSRVPSSQQRTMKPADTKPKTAPKTEPAKSTQTTVPKSTTTSSTVSTVKPSTEKVPAKQDLKAVPQRNKSDTTVTSRAVGKAAAASVVATSKPKDEVKEEKKTVSVDQIAAVPDTSGKDDALDLLIDSLGGPENVPESPKFTGPEIADTPATSEYVEELGKRDSTIPPEYRHLLDGKGDKPVLPPKEAEKSLGDDDLVAAFSSDFVSSPAPPEEKKPKLEELQKKDAKPTSSAPAAPAQPSAAKIEAKPSSSAPAAPLQPSPVALSEDALDELLGTLEGPPTYEPESPQFTGPEVTETITKTYLEELGKRDSTIPPEYRHLLDGKDHGKPIPPPAQQPPPMSDTSLVDEFSKDFETSISPAAETTPAFRVKDSAQDKQAKSDVVVPSAAASVQSAAASSVQSAAAPSASIDSALDELMGTLEGAEFSVPKSPVYTGPEVTEMSTATYIEELGKRESTIPPAYRNLLDGKADGPPVPQTPEDKAMTDSELADAFDKEFSCPEPPVAQQTPPVTPKETPDGKKSESEIVVSAASSSSLQAAPVPSKAPAAKGDPLDALAGTLGTRKDDPKDKQPGVDKVKEKTGKESREKLGEDEETIPPDYRLKEVKDKDGKPLLPKPEEKPQAMSEDELLDALTEGFDTTPVPSQCAPLQSSAKAPGKSGSEEMVSCSKASAVQSSAAARSVSIPDDALDLLSSSLGERQPDPDENKPVVDMVKERVKEEHIDRLGDRDDTIPPEYRHLLDGKDQGKPAKPEAVKPQTSLDDAAAIDLLSGGFASCETKATDKTQNSSQDKVEKGVCSAPVSKASGKVPEASKNQVEKGSSVQKPETSGKVADSSKSTGQSTLEKPGAQKIGKS
ncbi:calpastatin isoform X4 [Hyla sarda]|uniref:calpastatin isoform X4 n=1 Tax=Hyla sarda TaxID=327740 RepID=UPI0024C3EC70|nr:calpastatin isoform X4 [Hyla sarda]